MPDSDILQQVRDNNYEYDDNVIACPHCGRIASVSFNSSGHTHGSGVVDCSAREADWDTETVDNDNDEEIDEYRCDHCGALLDMDDIDCGRTDFEDCFDEGGYVIADRIEVKHVDFTCPR